MSIHHFRIDDPANPWAKAIEVEATDEEEARMFAGSYLFARRTTGEAEGSVHLTLESR
jgi:hypothetical protein